ncbi:hypothetical protein SL914_17940 [Klebsiella pneumoniae]
MTDITELAQREKFEAWVITQICISKSTLEGLRTSDGYRNSTLSGRDYNLMWNLWKAAGAELVEALEKAQQRIAELEEAEQKLCAANVTLDARAELAERRLAEMESRTVTVRLPRPGFVTISGERTAVYLKADVDTVLAAAGIGEAE